MEAAPNRRQREEEEEAPAQQQQGQNEAVATADVAPFFRWNSTEKKFYCVFCHPHVAGLTLANFPPQKDVKSNTNGKFAGRDGRPNLSISAVQHVAEHAAFKNAESRQAWAAANLNIAPITTHAESEHPGGVFKLKKSERTTLMFVLLCAPFAKFDDRDFRWAAEAGAPDAPGCGKTAKLRVLALRDKMRLQLLRARFKPGTRVSLAFDKGTIYSGMLAFMIRDVRTGAKMVWRIAPTEFEERYKGRVTGDALCEEVVEIFNMLKSEGIQLVSIVTDGGANMKKCVKKAATLLPVLDLPCFAHASQLVVKKVEQEQRNSAAINQTKEIRVQANHNPKFPFRLPAANDTRWSSRQRLAKAILQRKDALRDIGIVLSDEEIDTLTRLTEELEPAAHFTDFVQRDNCTFLEAMCAISLLYKTDSLRAAMTNVDDTFISRFFCDAGFLFAFYSPVFDLKTFEQKNEGNVAENLLAALGATYDGMKSYLASLGIEDLDSGALMKEIAGPTATPELRVPTMVKQLTQYRTRAVKILTQNPNEVTAAQFTAMLDTTIHSFFPLAAKVLKSICRCLPTEAMCETLFSIAKQYITPQRYNLAVDNAAAAIEIRFLNNQKIEVPEDVVPMLDGDEVLFFDREDGAPMTTEVAVAYVECGVDSYVDMANKKGNAQCLHCKKAWRVHEMGDPNKVLQCTNARTCGRRWCYTVACINPMNPLLHDELPPNDGQWKCANCERAEAFGGQAVDLTEEE